MYPINPPLVTAKGRIFYRNTKHLQRVAWNDFNALGNKANTIIKNENTQRWPVGLSAIKRGNWQGTADEAENNLWARQTRHRATDIAAWLRGLHKRLRRWR